MMGLHSCNNTISVSVIFCALVSYHSFSLLQFNSPWRKKNFQLIQGGSSYSKYWFTNTGWLNLSSWYSYHLPVSFLAPFLEVGSLPQGQLNWHTELLWSTGVHCLAGREGQCPCRGCLKRQGWKLQWFESWFTCCSPAYEARGGHLQEKDGKTAEEVTVTAIWLSMLPHRRSLLNWNALAFGML